MGKARKKREDQRTAMAKDWDAVRVLYLKGESLEHIIQSMPKVYLTKELILNQMSKEGMTAVKSSINQKVVEHIEKTIIADKEETNKTCVELFSSGADIIRALLAQYGQETQKENIPKTQAKATAYNVDLLMSGVTKIQKGLRVAYGMDADGKLVETEPEVTIIDNLNITKI